MSSLKDLVANELQFMTALIESEGEVKESMTDMQVKSDMLPQKVDNYHYRMSRIKSEIDYMKSRKKEIDSIIKRLKAADDWLKENMKFGMLDLGVDEIKGLDRRFKLSKSEPKVDVDESVLPAEYCREEVVIKPDLKKIEEELRAGRKVPGARLVEVYKLNNYANGSK